MRAPARTFGRNCGLPPPPPARPHPQNAKRSIWFPSAFHAPKIEPSQRLAMTSRLTAQHPRLRLLRRRPAHRRRLGRLRPGEPEEPPQPLLAPPRADRPRRRHPRAHRHHPRPARAAPRRRHRPPRRRRLHPPPRRPPARHRRPAHRGAEPPRPPAGLGRRRDRRAAHVPLRLCLRAARRQPLPADPRPPGTSTAPSWSTAPAARSRLRPFRVRHGRIEALGFRIHDFAYLPDVSEIPDDAWPALAGLDTFVLDALRRTAAPDPHPPGAEPRLARPRRPAPRASLTNMHNDLDYATLAAELPPGVIPAYDGLILEIAA